MKYYSEKLNSLYDSVEALEQAELDFRVKKEAEEKAKAEAEAKKKEETQKRMTAKAAVDEAFKKAYQLRNSYVDKYGSYSIAFDENEKLFKDLMNALFS